LMGQSFSVDVTKCHGFDRGLFWKVDDIRGHTMIKTGAETAWGEDPKRGAMVQFNTLE